MDIDPLRTLGALAAAAASFMTLIKLYKRVLIPTWRKLSNAMFSNKQLLKQVHENNVAQEARLAQIATQMTEITAQLRNNGGSTIKDALDRIENRQSLQEQRQRAIISDMSVGVFETNAEGRMSWVNRHYCMLVGRVPDDLLGYGWRNTIPAESRERVLAEWQSGIDERRDFEITHSVATPHGILKKVHIKASRLLDAKGNVAGYFGLIEFIH